MGVIRRFARWYVGGIRDLLTSKADRIRVRTCAHQEQLRKEGAPEEYVRRQVEFPLAWAKFLDALAGRGA